MPNLSSYPLYQAIGLMSGTSMDAIDAALIETDGYFNVRSLGGFSIPHDPEFYAKMKAIEKRGEGVNEIVSPEIQAIIRILDDQHAEAVLGLLEHLEHESSKKVTIIGYHGQTIYHQPAQKKTVQWGNPQYLADRLKIPVMGDVRQNDVQHGGQGAPIAPIYHQALAVRDNLLPAVVINCGGIANVTGILGKTSSDLVGFDAGPGNGLLDRWVYEKTKGKESMDKNGQYALKGQVNEALLKALFTISCEQNGINFYKKKPPKSLDIRDFHWPEAFSALSLEDGCATLAFFTAQCIVEAFQWVTTSTSPIRHVVLVGGGWHNPFIKKTLQQFIEKKYGTSIHMATGDDMGWSTQYLEAELMAFLAVRCLNHQPITFPTTTGVPYSLIGGKIFTPNTLLF